MLKLKLQYFGHSLEKTLMLRKIEGKRKRGKQRMRWFDSLTDLIDMNLRKVWKIVEDRRAWPAVVRAVTESKTRLSK